MPYTFNRVLPISKINRCPEPSLPLQLFQSRQYLLLQLNHNRGRIFPQPQQNVCEYQSLPDEALHQLLLQTMQAFSAIFCTFRLVSSRPSQAARNRLPATYALPHLERFTSAQPRGPGGLPVPRLSRPFLARARNDVNNSLFDVRRHFRGLQRFTC